jgi:hypothetical protein
MKIKNLLSHLITKGVHLFFMAFALIWISYTSFPLILWASELSRLFSWYLKIPIIIFFAVVSCALSIVGAMPLFWLDRVKIKKNGWLGNLYKQIAEPINGEK